MPCVRDIQDFEKNTKLQLHLKWSYQRTYCILIPGLNEDKKLQAQDICQTFFFTPHKGLSCGVYTPKCEAGVNCIEKANIVLVRLGEDSFLYVQMAASACVKVVWTVRSDVLVSRSVIWEITVISLGPKGVPGTAETCTISSSPQ